jgi:hypothetical protein
MFDLTQIRVAEGKFVCNILPHKNLGRSQQHLMMEAPLDVEIDPVEQRTGDARKVTLDQGRRAIAIVQGISVKRYRSGLWPPSLMLGIVPNLRASTAV